MHPGMMLAFAIFLLTFFVLLFVVVENYQARRARADERMETGRHRRRMLTILRSSSSGRDGISEDTGQELPGISLSEKIAIEIDRAADTIITNITTIINAASAIITAAIAAANARASVTDQLIRAFGSQLTMTGEGEEIAFV